MLNAVWMSDLHFAARGAVLGHNPRARLASAIDHINTHYPDSELCIISGDMVNRGTEEDYAAVAQALNDLTIPCWPMVGNHDDRALFKAVFALPKNCMADFVQYSVSTSEGEFICLDTLKAGSDEGEFCNERLRWLAERLNALGDTPAYIFMHHPPMKLGLPNLVDNEALLALMSAHSSIKHLFIGHVHRPITGTVNGIPFATMRAVLFQAPAPLPEWDWKSFKPGEEAPSFGALAIDDGNVNLQFVQFCQYQDGLV